MQAVGNIYPPVAIKRIEYNKHVELTGDDFIMHTVHSVLLILPDSWPVSSTSLDYF